MGNLGNRLEAVIVIVGLFGGTAMLFWALEVLTK